MFASHFIEALEARIALAFAAEFDLAALNGRNGFQLSAGAAGDLLGRSVGGADVNGDGFSDLIAGADYADAQGKDSGAAYIIFGKAKGFAPNLEVSALDGRNGFRVVGNSGNNLLGCAVSGAGDVNGDGIDDFILGARVADGSGAAYVIFGTREGFPAKLKVSALNGTNGFKLAGEFGGAHTGISVSGAGDVNGDDFGDVIVGAVAAGPSGLFPGGAAYIVFGKSNGFGAFLALASLDGEDGIKLEGAEGDLAGKSVSGAGDINGDGFDDVIVGAYGDSPSGAAFVVFGKAAGFTNLELPALDGSEGFKLSGEEAGDYAGVSVSGAGDINGDGLDDLIVGAYRAFRGKAYIVFGRAGAYPANVDLSTVGGDNGFKVVGPEDGYDSGIGKDVSAAGDVNGDGIADIIIGAYDGATANGASYVVFGSMEELPANLEISSLDGSNGFKVRGISNGHSSFFPSSGVGDINGDGLADLAIGGFGESPRGHISGAAYVIFGGDPGRLKIATGGLSATYTDPEGDKVTVTTSAGKLKPEIFDMRPEGLGFQLETLTVTNTGMVKDIALSAQRQDANHDGMLDGDGRVNVGAINGTGMDLGKVRVKGDLGQIDAGDNDPNTAAITLLKVRSLGALGTTTQDPTAPSLHSDIAGDLKTLIVKADVSNGVTLAVQGRIGDATIGGDLDNSTISALGTMIATNPKQNVALGSLIIGGNVRDSRILGGYDLQGGASNPDAMIGVVQVGGAWTASDLVCGIADTSIPGDLNSPPDGFGHNDTLIAGGSGIAGIARVIIKGSAIGSAASATDHFGITAGLIREVKINGAALALTASKENLLLDAENDDFRLVEL